MSDALRHTLRSIELPGGDTMTRLEIHPDGEWVRFEDYEAALQRVEAAEHLCKIYFEIAASALGECEVSKRRRAAMQAEGEGEET